MSASAKTRLLDAFQRGDVKILFCTDAAGMGCNVPDIDVIIIAGDPTSISAVAQRWGRAGRDRERKATCLLLAPKWAFKKSAPVLNAAAEALVRKGKGREDTHATKTSAQPKPETKRAETKRAEMQDALRELCNLGSSRSSEDGPAGKWRRQCCIA